MRLKQNPPGPYPAGMRSVALLIATAGILVLAGCASPQFGANALRQEYKPYNESLALSANEQILLNMVRLKYRDTPFFLEIASITSQPRYQANVGVGVDLPDGPGANVFKPNAGLQYSEGPVISYQPLSGENFIKRMLSPVPLEAILVLSQSGWSIERLLRVCVEHANHLYNAPTASGPTPAGEPEFRDFQVWSHALRSLSLRHQVLLVPPSDPPANRFTLQLRDLNLPESRDFLNLAGLKPEGDQIRITSNIIGHGDAQTLNLRNRSMIGILFCLGQNIEIPPAHVERGLVTQTRRADGTLFDWNEVSGDLLRIHSSTAATPPVGAHVRVRYRDAWFYIADNDLNSKSTFLLLTQLYNLQSGNVMSMAPNLSISVGN